MAGVCCVRKCQAILKIDFRNFGLKTFVAAQQNRNVSELNMFISETVPFVVSVFRQYFYLKILGGFDHVMGGSGTFPLYILIYTKLGR